MNEHKTDPAEPARDYEDRDIHLKPLVLFLVFTAIFTASAFFSLRLLFRGLAESAQKADQPWSEFSGTRQLPDAPLLQVEPPKELAEHRANEDAVLYSYGWIDKSAGTVRIPVERAIDLLVERDVLNQAPVEEPPPAETAEPAVDPEPKPPQTPVPEPTAEAPVVAAP